MTDKADNPFRSASAPPVPQVLVVDDDPVARAGVVDLLEEAGHPARAAESATEAMQLLLNGSYRVVVSDLQMPGFSGDRLAEVMVRSLDVPPQVVYFSSLPEPDLRRIAARTGQRFFVRKGAAKADFLRVVRQAFAAGPRLGERTGVGSSQGHQVPAPLSVAPDRS